MYRMMSGEREQLIKQLGVYYKQHMSGQNRRKEMLAILVLLDRSGMKNSKTAQESPLFDIEKSTKGGIIKSPEQNQSDGGEGSGNFGHGGRPGKLGGSSTEGSKSSNSRERLSSLRKKTANRSRKTLKLSKKEYGKVTSEISTYYKSNYESRVGMVCGVYKEGKFYLFENYGFDSYRIFASFKYNGNEDVIELILEELRDGKIE